MIASMRLSFIRDMKKWLWLIALGAAAIGICIAYYVMPIRKADAEIATATDSKPLLAAYVENTVCLSCHAEQGRQWAGSHHAHAMEVATGRSVRGDFGGRMFLHDGVRTRFFQRGDRYFVNTDGPDGRLRDFEIAYTFGVEPLQQYLIAMPGGRLQALQIAWDDQRKQWFHLRGHEKTPPGDVLHWTGRYQTANTMCIACHTTAFQKNYDPVEDRFNSNWKEANVSCQSCHGPGEQHVNWARSTSGHGATPSSQMALSKGLVVDFHSKDLKIQDVCAACHSRRSDLSAQPVVKHPLLDNYLPSLLREGLYYPDGQQRDEVYVDGSFRQSKMFQKGVTCTNCHNPHSGKIKVEGNALCMQCHSTQVNAAFPAAAAKPATPYDSTAHHFHKVGSAGAQCVNCHMPSKVYMGIQQRPDHSLRIPRPDLSVKIGVPNACNNCHVDKSAQWASEAVARWYGPNHNQNAHYGEALSAYRAGDPAAEGALVGLIANAGSKEDGGVAPIVRATALEELRNNPQFGMPVRISALYDRDDAVRTAAVDGLAQLEPVRRMELLAPLLKDPVRAVRMAAVRNLSSIARNQFTPDILYAFDGALAEYIEVQNLSADMPGARLNLAVIYQNTGQMKLAERQYLAALHLDPDFTPARLNLAQFYAMQGRFTEAMQVLKDGLARVPNVGEMQYSLALLLAQDGKLPAALAALKKAATLLPSRGRIQYNLALAYQQSGQNKLAELAFLNAARIAPSDPDTLYALAAFYFRTHQYAQAQHWGDQLAEMAPTDSRLANLRRALAQTDAN